MATVFRTNGEIVDIPNDLKSLQDAVGGYIEVLGTASVCDKDVYILGNEDGIMLNLPLNNQFVSADFRGNIVLINAEDFE